MPHNKLTLNELGLNDIDRLKMIDTNLYIPTTKLNKENIKRKRSEYKVYPFKVLKNVFVI